MCSWQKNDDDALPLDDYLVCAGWAGNNTFLKICNSSSLIRGLLFCVIIYGRYILLKWLVFGSLCTITVSVLFQFFGNVVTSNEAASMLFILPHL